MLRGCAGPKGALQHPRAGELLCAQCAAAREPAGTHQEGTGTQAGPGRDGIQQPSCSGALPWGVCSCLSRSRVTPSLVMSCTAAAASPAAGGHPEREETLVGTVARADVVPHPAYQS